MTDVLESEHDSKIAGHMGQDKTLELIRHHFVWPEMKEGVNDYVRSCLVCQRMKCLRHARYGLHHPLELAIAPWQSLSIDFTVDLPLSKGCAQIWVIVDRFTKIAHFIPLKDEAKKTPHLAPIFANEIWRHHGLPTDIVSNHDRLFTSDFWSKLCNYVGIS
jgi:hypothetical protein